MSVFRPLFFPRWTVQMFSLMFSFPQRPLFHYGNVHYREFSIFANVLEQSKRLLNLTPTLLVWNTNMAALSLFLAHQNGCRDVMWKRFIVRQIQNKIDLNEVLWARETKQPPQTPVFTKTAGHKTFPGWMLLVTTFLVRPCKSLQRTPLPLLSGFFPTG